MSTDTDDLREIFLDVAEDGTVTERQEESHSHDPLEDDELEATLNRAAEDGLDDAVDADFDARDAAPVA